MGDGPDPDRGGSDPVQAAREHLAAVNSNGSVLAIPGINVEPPSTSRSGSVNGETTTADHVVDPYSIVFEGYLEIAIADDGDLRLADQNGGNWSAEFTPPLTRRRAPRHISAHLSHEIASRSATISAR